MDIKKPRKLKPLSEMQYTREELQERIAKLKKKQKEKFEVSEAYQTTGQLIRKSSNKLISLPNMNGSKLSQRSLFKSKLDSIRVEEVKHTEDSTLIDNKDLEPQERFARLVDRIVMNHQKKCIKELPDFLYQIKAALEIEDELENSKLT